jgi:dipeptidyl-peptidase-4
MTADLRAQHLSRLGFLVFKLDNRGSARRGLDFEGAIRHRLGHIEVQDQIDGVNCLIDKGLADPHRVGIYGWSYGGYMAAMCLAQAPDVFKVAVAGAPWVHPDGYDTHYTERYLGTPQSNPQGYQESSVSYHVEGITGKLLLIHGLIDENVHFRHTARLINALIRARKPYDLLLVPDARHMPRKLEDRIYMEERIRDYFVQNL